MPGREREALPLEGDLEQHPLPELIALILDEKLNGVLHIDAEKTSFWIYFEQGFPAGVHNPKSQDYLGSVLRELGYIDDETFNQSLAVMARTNALQGQVLSELGCLDEEKLQRGLSVQLARKLTRLFALRAGRFRFVEDEALPPPNEAIRINPYALIYNAICNNYEAQDLKKGLAPLVGKSVRVSRRFAERGQLFELPAEELADVKLLEAFRLPQAFVRSARSGATAAMMMLLTLRYCNMLQIEEAALAEPLPVAPKAPRPAEQLASANPLPARATRPPRSTRGTPSRPAGLASRASEAAPASLRAKIDEKFEQIKTGEPWEILEVEREADDGQLKQALFALAKVYHPDRVARTEDEAIKHRMEVITAKINEAYQLWIDPQARMAYLAKNGKQTDPAAKKGVGSRPEEAKIQFQKAMVFYRKRDLAKAADALRWAVELDPSQSDYLAWRHWIDCQRSEGPEDKKLQKTKDKLLVLLESKPACFFATRFLSKIFQQLGQDENHERYLKLAHQINPKDIETARELRLYHMRKEKKAKKGKILGIRLKKT